MLNAKQQSVHSCEKEWWRVLGAKATYRLAVARLRRQRVEGLKETRSSVECNCGCLGSRLVRVFRAHKDWAGPRGQTSTQLHEYVLSEWRAIRENLLRCHKEFSAAENRARARERQSDLCPCEG